jgi:hypothetical protein
MNRIEVAVAVVATIGRQRVACRAVVAVEDTAVAEAVDPAEAGDGPGGKRVSGEMEPEITASQAGV